MTDFEVTEENTLIAPSKATFWQEMRAIITLGTPMALTQLIQFSIYTVDLLMIGQLGPEYLAAASLTIFVYFTVYLFGMGPSMAVAPMVSQSLGRNRKDLSSVRGAVRMALWVIIGFFPIAIALFAISHPLLKMAGQPDVAVDLTRGYVFALAASLPAALGVMVLRNFMASVGRTFVPLVIITVSTALNAVLNYALIFGEFGFPRLELVGAGLASTTANITAFIAMMIYANTERTLKTYEIFKRFWVPQWDKFREVLSLGWPIGLTTAFEAMLFNVAILIMGWVGGDAEGEINIAAYQIALNVAAFAFMIPLGLSLAGSVRVGIAAGEGSARGVRQASIATIIVATAVISVFAVFVAGFSETIAGWYLDPNEPDEIKTHALAASFMLLAAGFMVFDGIQVAANQCLRGLKDVRWPMVLAGIAYWPIGFGSAYYLSLHTPVGPHGVWWGLLFSLATASVLLGGRLWWMSRQPLDQSPNTLAEVF